MDIIDNILARMSEKKISAKEMAAAIGVSPSAFSKWKQRKNVPTIKNLTAMAQVLGCTLSELTAGVMPLTGFASEEDAAGAANDAPQEKPKDDPAKDVDQLIWEAFEKNDMRVLFNAETGVTPQDLIKAMKIAVMLKEGNQ